MSKVFQTVFGGSKSKESSSNQAYAPVSAAMSPLLGNAATGSNALQAMLSGDTSGFETFKKSTGFDAMAEQGSRGITGNAAAGGLLRSGSTGKALSAYGNNLQNQFAGNYMDRLMGQAGLGFSAANSMAATGGVSTGKSSNKPGMGQFIGAMMASDRRLKKNIKKITTLDNGLGLYKYDYIDGRGPYIGVMADEVEQIMPEALGPVVDGYATVDYNKISEVL